MLVPGDVIALAEGDAVPADAPARLVTATALRIDESPLPARARLGQDADRSLAPDVPLAERVTMAYLGTLVVHGKGQALIISTGAQTELGRIATAPGTTQSEETPLEATLRVFGRRVLWVCVVVSALLFRVGRHQGRRHLERRASSGCELRRRAHPRRAAGHHRHRARNWNATDGQAWRHCPSSARRRGAGRYQRDLL